MSSVNLLRRKKAAALASIIDSNNTSAISTDDSNPHDNEEYQTILDNIIGEKHIIKVSGTSKLHTITHLELVIDTNVQSLLDVNEHVPNLTSLVLDNSVISSIRDLGIGFRCLTALSLNSCNLYDIDGIGVLTGLHELSLCDNFIVDITGLAMHDNIKVINLSGNNINSIDITDTLSSCPSLRSLFLNRNPIDKLPNYRLIITSLVTTLQLLDGVQVDTDAKSKVSNGMIMAAVNAMHIQNEELDDEKRLENDIYVQVSAGSHSSKSTNGSSVSLTSAEEDLRVIEMRETGSELTHGSAVVLAGNVAAAMRRRRSDDSSSSSSSRSNNGISRDVHLRSNEVSIPFFSEGDVTNQAQGLEVPDQYMINNSSNNSSNSSSYRDHEHFHDKNRPKSAAVTSSRTKGTIDITHNGSSSNGGIKYNQNINNQRPQSAVGRNRSSNQQQPSAPFKIAADHEDLRMLRVTNTQACTPVKIVSNTFKGNGVVRSGSSSVVHRDVVWRNCIATVVDDDDSLDDSRDNDTIEDIGITHAARHRLMSASGSRKGNVTNINKQLTSSNSITESPASILARNTLVGSPSDDDYVSANVFGSKSNDNNSAGISLGFNLVGSLAAIDQWVDDNDDDDTDDEQMQVLRTSITRRAWSAGKSNDSCKVLSRDVIISMCSATDETTTDGDDILDRNGIFDDSSFSSSTKYVTAKNPSTSSITNTDGKMKHTFKDSSTAQKSVMKISNRNGVHSKNTSRNAVIDYNDTIDTNVKLIVNDSSPPRSE